MPVPKPVLFVTICIYKYSLYTIEKAIYFFVAFLVLEINDLYHYLCEYYLKNSDFIFLFLFR